MDGRQRERVIDDPLAREIEAALAVEPSPEFGVRLRERLAVEASRRRPVRWMVPLSAGAAALAALLLVDRSAIVPQQENNAERSITARSLPVPVDEAPIVRVERRPMTTERPPVEHAGSSRSAWRAASSARPVAVANRAHEAERDLAVIISPAERRGFELLLSQVPARGVVAAEDATLARVGIPVLAPLAIDPVIIASFDEYLRTEGANP